MFDVYLYSGDAGDLDLMVVVRFHTSKFYNDSMNNRKEVSICETSLISRYDWLFEWRYRRVVAKLIKRLMKRKELQRYVYEVRI